MKFSSLSGPAGLTLLLTAFSAGVWFGSQNPQGSSTSGVLKAPKPDQLLARVNGVEIKTADVEDVLWEARGQEILNEVIYYHAAKSEADRLKIILTEQEVEQGLQQTIAEMKANLADGVSYAEMLAQTGQSPTRLRMGVKASLYLTKIAFAKFDSKSYVKVSTIILKPKSNSVADLSEAIQRSNAIYDRLNKGEAWEKLIDETVSDVQGRQTRGYLGWRVISAFPSEAQTEFSTLAKGKVTHPVQTQNGIQIFRLEGKGSDLTPSERTQMQNELSESLRTSAANEIGKNLKIERFYPPSSVNKSG